jgi:hypothetical protein
MPCIASGKIKPRLNGQSCAHRIVLSNNFRCDPLEDVHQPDHHRRCTAVCESGLEALPTDASKPRSIDRCSESGRYYIVYPRGKGASVGSAPCGYADVSRWASLEEAEDWLRNSGSAIPPSVGGDRLYVALPGARQPGGTGPVRVDFAAPQSALIQTGKAEWRMILQPIQSTPIHNVVLTVPNGVTLANDQ